MRDDVSDARVVDESIGAPRTGAGADGAVVAMGVDESSSIGVEGMSTSRSGAGGVGSTGGSAGCAAVGVLDRAASSYRPPIASDKRRSVSGAVWLVDAVSAAAAGAAAPAPAPGAALAAAAFALQPPPPSTSSDAPPPRAGTAASPPAPSSPRGPAHRRARGSRAAARSRRCPCCDASSCSRVAVLRPSCRPRWTRRAQPRSARGSWAEVGRRHRRVGAVASAATGRDAHGDEAVSDLAEHDAAVRTTRDGRLHRLELRLPVGVDHVCSSARARESASWA